ncbi:MAG: hypothetical protein PHF20_06505 [Halothiobacillaceae bacterium]|nr:hypothetical protein [Halothiobacillaceae bacterium]
MMFYPSRIQIVVAVVAIAGVSGLIGGIEYSVHRSGRSISGQGQVFEPPPTAVVHTASWYVAHPDIAKQDEVRCGDNAATISQAACQNVESAEEQLLAIQMRNAADQNNVPTKSNAMKVP